MTTPRERAAILVQELRDSGCVFTLKADGPKVKFSEDCPSTPRLLEYLQAHREEVIALLTAEQQQGQRPAPARAAVERPAEPRPVPEATAKPAAGGQRVLLIGSGKWTAVEPIRERLKRLPKDVVVVLVGDVTAATKKGKPTGTAAIAYAEAIALGLVVEVVEEDQAFDQVGLAVVAHKQLAYSVYTSKLVDRARGLSIPVEMIQ